MNITLPTGIDCVYDRFGDHQRPTVMLLHGLSGNRETYGDVIAQLLATHGDCVQIVNVDLRGHGDSSRATSIEGYRAGEYAADIASLIGALELGPVLLAGHSLGGVVAATVAVEHPGSAHSLLLEDPPFFEGDDARRAVSPVASFFPMLVAATGDLQARNAPLAEFEALAATHSPPAEVADRARSLQRWDPATMQAAIDGIVWQGFDPVAVISCPVTVLRADPEFGAVFEPRDVEPVMAANPHARVHMVSGAAHSIHAPATVDAYLGHLNESIEAFVRAQ
jgi:pimeloyl-ACP methyl ester carboxylesterase